MKKPPITFIMPSLHTGGGNRVFVELAKELARNQSVEIIVPAQKYTKPTWPISRTIRLTQIGYSLDSPIVRIINLFLLFSHVALKKRHTIVIISDPLLSLFSFLVRSDLTYRFLQADDYIIFDDLYLLKNNFLLSIYKRLTKLSYSYKINYIFNSRFVYDSFIKISRRTEIPYNLVHPGVDFTYFHKPFNKPEGLINIGLVGRSHPWKGFADFINAWTELKAELADIVGQVFIISPDQLARFNLSGLTLVKPNNDEEVAALYQQIHIFISTSWWEGFGLPALEAMACGCAVIMSDCDGSHEYAVPNQNCLVYPPRDVKALKQLISSLTHNQRLMSELAEAGSSTAQQFTWQNSTAQLQNIIFAST